jgi:hypothetical protein
MSAKLMLAKGYLSETIEKLHALELPDDTRCLDPLLALAGWIVFAPNIVILSRPSGTDTRHFVMRMNCKAMTKRLDPIGGRSESLRLVTVRLKRRRSFRNRYTGEITRERAELQDPAVRFNFKHLTLNELFKEVTEPDLEDVYESDRA